MKEKQSRRRLAPPQATAEQVLFFLGSSRCPVWELSYTVGYNEHQSQEASSLTPANSTQTGSVTLGKLIKISKPVFSIQGW